jgi:hypothetical protein
LPTLEDQAARRCLPYEAPLTRAARANPPYEETKEKPMAKLTAARRNRLPKSAFAGPGRSYPVPDRSHAIFAKAMAKRQLKKGDMSRGQYNHIVGQANEKLHH